MKKIFALILTALVAMCGINACSNAQDVNSQQATTNLETSPEWVAELPEAENASQLFVVAGVGETTAYVSMHQKDADGNWRQIISTPGYIGKKGLYKTKEGDAKTPVGTFNFTEAFGIAENPGCSIRYTQVTEDNYWSGDQNYHYNKMVELSEYPQLNKEDSEHLIEVDPQYEYALNISYNEEGTAGLGSAIFLHCLGPQKPYTGGCVAIPREQMLKVMQHVDLDCVVVIDTLQNIAPDLYKDWDL